MIGARQRSAQPAAPVHRAGRRDPALERSLKRKGWALGAIALALYLGYLAWFVVGGPL
jgi:hypothetical protein